MVVSAETVSLLTGALTSSAWCVLIDAHVFDETVLQPQNDGCPPFTGVNYVPGIAATLGLIMISMTPLDRLMGVMSMFDDSISTKVRVWLYCSFTVLFLAIGGSVWIFAAVYSPPNNEGNQWPGIAIITQTLLLLIAAVGVLWAKQLRNSAYDPLV